MGEGRRRTGLIGCAAFPVLPGIPDAIFDNHHDHRKPYEGDHGIQFELRSHAGAEALARIE